MAKELPYFKFNVSEWISGAITLEDFYVQGVFINICSYYWFKSGCLTLTEIKRRVKSDPTITLLIENNLIKVTDQDNVSISFLDEQLKEFYTKSEINKINGSKGGAPKGNNNAKNEEKQPKTTERLAKNNRTVSEKQPKTTNIEREREREEEEERDKEKEKIKKEIFFENYSNAEEAFEEIKNDEIQIEHLIRIVKNAGLKSCNNMMIIFAIKHFFTVEGAKPEFVSRYRQEVRQHLVNWINKNAKTLDQYATNGIQR